MTTYQNGRASFTKTSNALTLIPYKHNNGEIQNFDLTKSTQDAAVYTAADPSYLSSQLKSTEWLHRYGLKSQKLTFDQILQQIGVKRVEASNTSFGKNVGAKYPGGMYQEIQHDSGERFMLTCRPEKLREFQYRLMRMLSLLRKRLTFITSGSRRIFGIIGEPSICIVCDCKTTDQRIFSQVQLAIISLFKEQIAKIKRFNIVWVSNDNEQYQHQPVDVTTTSIEEAIDWLSRRKCPRDKISMSATAEAMLKAFNNHVHSIYLISEGTSSDSAREILRDNIVKTRLSSRAPIPVHVVALFCNNNDTETFLQSLSQGADGTFTSYKINNSMITLKSPTNLSDSSRMNFQDSKLQFGASGINLKSESSTDVSIMYKEITECQNVIDRVEKILSCVKDENVDPNLGITKSMDLVPISHQQNKSENSLQRNLLIQSSALFNNDEKDMTSLDWLKIYGVKAQKLDYFSILQSVATQHCDGITTPNKNSTSLKDKLISEKYCDQFAHVTWPDGTIRHIYVTTEFQRDYERRMKALLEKINARLQWLKRGSRDTFGTIIENNVYILIDTSKSMQNHMVFLKEKLRLLIKEQLFGKEQINIVAFNTIINPWRDRLTRINNSIINAQIQPWIDGLHAEGSTNTLAAIRYALADSGTEAIYLLTDGRPDQNERHILTQIQYRQAIPIHTIAFNCQDQTANQFLFDLAKQTGGRFHAFNYGVEYASSLEMPESEDIHQLKDEIAYGEKDLRRITELRDECMSRTWSKDNIQTTYHSTQTNKLVTSISVDNFHTFDSSSSTMFYRSVEKPRPKRKRKVKLVTNLPERKKADEKNTNSFVLQGITEYPKWNFTTTSNLSGNENRIQCNAFHEVKSFLKTNSLSAKRLTIFDVLHPISVKIKQLNRVQIIDRYVLAKVWDDLFPFTNGSYANKFELTDHYAIDLEDYEMKLTDLINEYRQFITILIWNNLTDENKQALGPTLYWVTLSREEQYRYTRELTQEETGSHRKIEFLIWQKLTADQRENFLQIPVVYDEKTENVLKIYLEEAKAESVLQGVLRMDVEINRATKFKEIASNIRNSQQKNVTEHKSKGEQNPFIKSKPKVKRIIGERVLCRYDGDGFFYMGTIQQVFRRRVIVIFDTDAQQETNASAVIPVTVQNSELNLFIQDYVLIRREKSNETEECWVPGVILCVPAQCTLPSDIYTVDVYCPQRRRCLVYRKDMVRITLQIFEKTITFLRNIGLQPISDDRSSDGESDTSEHDGLSEGDLEKIHDKLIDPFIIKIKYINKLHVKRYKYLLEILIAQISAVKILVENSNKSKGGTTDGSTQIGGDCGCGGGDCECGGGGDVPIDDTIPTNTHVYAVWLDHDGLTYKSIVIESRPSNYIIERIDSPGVQCYATRKNIFLESEICPLKELDTKSFVLTRYPDDSRNYLCPAVVFKQDSYERKTIVRFYDCCDKSLANNTECIPITENQFEYYTSIRIEKEKSLLNKVIVGLNDEINMFMLGTVEERLENGHQYRIRWCNDRQSTQSDEHLFGVFNWFNNHKVGDYVLAIDDTDDFHKVAKIESISADKNTLTVKFLNLSRRDGYSSSREASVPSMTTFVITKAYFETIRRQIQQ